MCTFLSDYTFIIRSTLYEASDIVSEKIGGKCDNFFRIRSIRCNIVRYSGAEEFPADKTIRSIFLYVTIEYGKSDNSAIERY